MNRLEVLQRILRFLEGVERQGGIVLGLIHLVVEARVFFLQVAGVGKDDAAQIDRRRRGVNRAAESLFHQARNPAAVVEMRVRQDDGIDFASRGSGVSRQLRSRHSFGP